MNPHKGAICCGVALFAGGAALAQDADRATMRAAMLNMMEHFSGGDASLANEISLRDGIVFDGPANGRLYLVFLDERGIGVVEDRTALLDDVITSASPSALVFAGDWRNGSPRLSGEVSLVQDGLVELRLRPQGEPTVRIRVDRAGAASASTCACRGIGTSSRKTCSDEDCDSAVGCHKKPADNGKLFCKWGVQHTLVTQPVTDWVIISEFE